MRKNTSYREIYSPLMLINIVFVNIVAVLHIVSLHSTWHNTVITSNLLYGLYFHLLRDVCMKAVVLEIRENNVCGGVFSEYRFRLCSSCTEIFFLLTGLLNR